MKHAILIFLLIASVLLLVPQVSFAQPPVGDGFSLVPCGRVIDEGSSNEVCNFRHLMILVIRMINYLISLAAIVAMYHIFLMAFDLVTSLGQPEKIERSKKGISNAVVGFGMVVLVFVFVNLLVNGVLGNLPNQTREWWNINCLYNITASLDECTGPPQGEALPGGFNRPAGNGGDEVALDQIQAETFDPVPAPPNDNNHPVSCNDCIDLREAGIRVKGTDTFPYANREVARKLLRLEEIHRTPNWYVSEAFPPFANHSSSTHYNGLAVDINIINSNERIPENVAQLYRNARQAGFSVVVCEYKNGFLNQFNIACSERETTRGSHIHLSN